ncbi:DUF4212 domain-containing protein [Aquimarina aquimarini]|uniref:DUF4212 domain-containing protein n=1 Tax=Aquimarina aquimarini TaxID=1191734 RepID=UPI000D550A92|nr:DUF4212 domain-containing protein [Aquimarina aquimarini]
MLSNNQKYWKENIKYLTILLIAWAIVSFVIPVFFVESLNTIKIKGFKLGFWFAQQGSIISFLLIIIIYIYLINKLDKKYDVND